MLSQLSAGTMFAFLCVAAGFLLIVASVVFVIKGKAALNESGAANKFEWGKYSATLTSVVTLFVLGAVLIFAPFWRVQQVEADEAADRFKNEQERAKEPRTATLTGKLTGSNKEVRLLLVAKPDYDQLYDGEFQWPFPILRNRAQQYEIFYVDGATIIRHEVIKVDAPLDGSGPQPIKLTPVDVKVLDASVRHITPKKEVSDEELNSLNLR